MFKRFLAAVFASLTLAGAMSAAAQTPSNPPPSPTPAAQAPSGQADSPGGVSAGVAADPTFEYRLGAGDKLRVIVFGEDTLSGEFVVSASGTVELPLIGAVTPQGRPRRRGGESNRMADESRPQPSGTARMWLQSEETRLQPRSFLRRSPRRPHAAEHHLLGFQLLCDKVTLNASEETRGVQPRDQVEWSENEALGRVRPGFSDGLAGYAAP